MQNQIGNKLPFLDALIDSSETCHFQTSKNIYRSVN